MSVEYMRDLLYFVIFFMKVWLS